VRTIPTTSGRKPRICLGRKNLGLPVRGSGCDEPDWEVPYWYVDAAFAAMLVLLEAVNLGLGSLFMGVTPDFVPRFRAEFSVPEEFQPIGALLVGHRHPDVRPNYRSDRRLGPQRPDRHNDVIGQDIGHFPRETGRSNAESDRRLRLSSSPSRFVFVRRGGPGVRRRPGG
jgi:hypothetical protein